MTRMVILENKKKRQHCYIDVSRSPIEGNSYVRAHTSTIGVPFGKVTNYGSMHNEKVEAIIARYLKRGFTIKEEIQK